MSFGPAPCDTQIPSVFTRVAGFRFRHIFTHSITFSTTQTSGHCLGPSPHWEALIHWNHYQIPSKSIFQRLDWENGGAKWRVAMISWAIKKQKCSVLPLEGIFRSNMNNCNNFLGAESILKTCVMPTSTNTDFHHFLSNFVRHSPTKNKCCKPSPVKQFIIYSLCI